MCGWWSLDGERRSMDARLRERPDGPVVFLEYAAGLDLGWFMQIGAETAWLVLRVFTLGNC